MTRQLLIALLALGVGPPAVGQDRPKIGESITTESGLVYKFTQLGKGPLPQTGDLMVIHGIGTLAPLDGVIFADAHQAVPSIHLIVNRGHATLKGVVANRNDANLANIRARSVPGLFSVKIELTIESEEPR